MQSQNRSHAYSVKQPSKLRMNYAVSTSSPLSSAGSSLDSLNTLSSLSTSLSASASLTTPGLNSPGASSGSNAAAAPNTPNTPEGTLHQHQEQQHQQQPRSTPRRVPSKSNTSNATPKDVSWEFAAPKFVDFTTLVSDTENENGQPDPNANPWSNAKSASNANANPDAWFGMLIIPLHACADSYPGPSRVARPSALLKQLEDPTDPGRESNTSVLDDEAPTPKASSKLVRPKTAGPTRPTTASTASAAVVIPKKTRPATAHASSTSTASSNTTTTILHKKPSASTTEIGKLFANLSLKPHPAVKRVPSDPEAKARLLEGTAASKARAAAAAEGSMGLLHATTSANSVKTARAASAHSSTSTTTSITSNIRKGPTVPKEFHFASRATAAVASKSTATSGGNAASNSINRDRFRAKSPGIKKRKVIIKKQVSDLTVPKPFRFHETSSHHRFNRNAAALSDKSPFVPLVNRVKQFELEVPDRFRAVPVKRGTTQASHMLTRLTKPHSPMLRTKSRAKTSVNVKTTEELELEEMAKAPRFKAQPVNKKILKGPHIGVPPPPKPSLTVPKSPHFSKISRSASAAIANKPASPPKIIKANPIRYAGTKPFEPVLEHRQILPDDVHLPGEEMRLKKLREFEDSLKRKQEDDERLRIFHANPVPDLSAIDPLPEVKPKLPTEPEPFKLLTQTLPPRSAFQTADMMSSQDLMGTKFTAQPVPQVEPFVPKRSCKPPTMPEPVLLHTDSRVEERRIFDEAKREREREEEAMREVARLEREELERQEVRRLRQEQVHQAQPVRTFPGIQIHASQRRLTEPESPMLKEKRERLAKMRVKLGVIRERNRPGKQEQSHNERGGMLFDGVASAAEGVDVGGGAGNGLAREDDFGEDYFEVKEVPGGLVDDDDDDDEFGVSMGEFEAGDEDGESGSVNVSGRRKKWAAPVEWIDSDGVATSGGF
ncbi:UNVERIFIED_CONTAM: hypothetical protein HDU68_001465 [Siphonaria sp. JEL0065]|nr:hypothetical protein HDU68_001465 [Siphonaria sp. JEL0065]